MVIAFVQFTNALEYMMFSPVLHLWLQISLCSCHLSQAMYPVCNIWSRPVGNYRLYWIDRCNKKHFLIANMVPLAMATLLTTFTTSFPLLSIALLRRDWLAVRQMAVGITILIKPHNWLTLRGKCWRR